MKSSVDADNDALVDAEKTIAEFMVARGYQPSTDIPAAVDLTP